MLDSTYQIPRCITFWNLDPGGGDVGWNHRNCHQVQGWLLWSKMKLFIASLDTCDGMALCGRSLNIWQRDNSKSNHVYQDHVKFCSLVYMEHRFVMGFRSKIMRPNETVAKNLIEIPQARGDGDCFRWLSRGACQKWTTFWWWSLPCRRFGQKFSLLWQGWLG